MGLSLDKGRRFVQWELFYLLRSFYAVVACCF